LLVYFDKTQNARKKLQLIFSALAELFFQAQRQKREMLSLLQGVFLRLPDVQTRLPVPQMH
jgi:hypothetical protein